MPNFWRECAIASIAMLVIVIISSLYINSYNKKEDVKTTEPSIEPIIEEKLWIPPDDGSY